MKYKLKSINYLPMLLNLLILIRLGVIGLVGIGMLVWIMILCVGFRLDAKTLLPSGCMCIIVSRGVVLVGLLSGLG